MTLSDEGRIRVREWARRLRIFAGAGVFLLAGRFCWLSVSAASTGLGPEPPPPRQRNDEALIEPKGPSVDLEALEKLANSEVSQKESAPQVRQRRLLIDVGPARSKAYVNGRYVGRTPYAGQWGCADGDEISIDVIPPQGMPIKREAQCRGQTIKADRGPTLR